MPSPGTPSHTGSAMPDYHGDEWDPAFAASQETGSVVVFHFGGALQRMPRSPFDVIPHSMPFQTAIFASELLWSPIMRKFPELEVRAGRGGHRVVPVLAREGRLRLRAPPSLDRPGLRRQAAERRSSGTACWSASSTTRPDSQMRHRIGIDNLAWECDYPHSDSTWPEAPEVLMKSFAAVGVSGRRDPQDHLAERVPVL